MKSKQSTKQLFRSKEDAVSNVRQKAYDGTKKETTARIGSRLLLQVTGGGSYLSAGSRALAWGLVDTEKPLSLAIRWPGGELLELPWEQATVQFLIREGADGAAAMDTAAGGD